MKSLAQKQRRKTMWASKQKLRSSKKKKTFVVHIKKYMAKPKLKTKA